MSTTDDHKGSEQVYELGYLVLPSIAEDSLPEVVSSIKKVVEKEGGKTLGGEDPFLIDLAYSMSKTVGASKYVVDTAYMGWFKFDLPAVALAEAGSIHPVEGIIKAIEKMPEILRSLLVKAPRETVFTFAEARAKALEEENKGEEVEIKEVVEPAEVVLSDVETVVE
jgi:hypothetical protein